MASLFQENRRFSRFFCAFSRYFKKNGTFLSKKGEKILWYEKFSVPLHRFFDKHRH